jgi:uncharacterized protein (DUF1330 family)
VGRCDHVLPVHSRAASKITKAPGNPAVVYEDGLTERTVITEYPSLEKATASYGSPAYQEALKALGDGAVRDVRIIEGGRVGV